MIEQIGGVFLSSNDPEAMGKWYKETLNLSYVYEQPGVTYVSVLNYKSLDDAKRYSVLSFSKSESPIPEGANKAFRLNLRVTSMEKALEELKQKNVSVRGPETHDQGTFAWIHDPDGNEIELWQDPS
ncbi:MAG: VOC family protein [Flavobacteriales bacterium]|nr:VOC family protein [Flavobacteriales bacterium]